MSKLVPLLQQKAPLFSGDIRISATRTKDWVPMAKSLPYFKTGRSVYIHRVRSGSFHYKGGEYTHGAVQYWCGGMGYLASPKRPHNTFLSELPENAILCATCEARAIGAGRDESRTINGHTVIFRPRI